MKTFLKLGHYTIYALGVIFAVILLVVGVSAMLNVAFTVGPHQQAIVLRFGEPKRVVDPGLQWKIPFAENVYYCDLRAQDLELTAAEAQMSDLTWISIDASTTYRIVDCLRLWRTAVSPAGLRGSLSTTLNSNLRETLGGYSLADLSHKRNEIVTDVEAQMKTVARSLGAKLMDVNLFFSVRQPPARRK